MVAGNLSIEQRKWILKHLWTLIETASCVELYVKVFRLGWMHVVTLMVDILST